MKCHGYSKGNAFKVLMQPPGRAKALRNESWALAKAVGIARTSSVLDGEGFLPDPKPMFALRLVFKVQLRTPESINVPRPMRAKIVAKTKLDPNGRFAHRNII